MSERESPCEDRNSDWRVQRGKLVPVLREAQGLIAGRIANHRTALCACQWCKLHRDIETALTYCPGGERYV